MTTVSFFGRWRRCSALWLAACLTVLVGRGIAAPNLRVFCDSAAWIGDSLSLRLQYEGNDPRDVQFPILDPQAYPGLEFFSAAPRFDTAYDKTTGLFTLRAAYPFTIYTAGTYALPPVSFRVFANGQILIYDTDTLWINVYEPDVDTEQAIRDIKDIGRVSFWERTGDYLRRNALWLSLTAAALAAGIFTWYALRRRRRDLPVFSAPKPPVPPLDQALSDLRKLKDKQLWQQNHIKEYYTELTDILRVFLAGEYRIAAVEMTSDECLDALRAQCPEAKQTLSELGRVFRTADLVKFAKGEPQPDEHEDCFRLIWRFVAAHKADTADGSNTARPASDATRQTADAAQAPVAAVDKAETAMTSPSQTQNDHELE